MSQVQIQTHPSDAPILEAREAWELLFPDRERPLLMAETVRRWWDAGVPVDTIVYAIFAGRRQIGPHCGWGYIQGIVKNRSRIAS